MSKMVFSDERRGEDRGRSLSLSFFPPSAFAPPAPTVVVVYTQGEEEWL